MKTIKGLLIFLALIFLACGTAYADKVTITKLKWKANKKLLIVHATSSEQPNAVLSVSGIGEMTYNTKKQKYILRLKLAENPGRLVVSSNLGGSAAATTQKDKDKDSFSKKDGDCNDSDAGIFPGAEEICEDGIDQNCDGTADEGCILPQYTLSVETSGENSVSLSPSGGVYNEGTVVTLTAELDAGWKFNNWSGDLTGSQNPATITMDGDKTVIATVMIEVPEVTFSVDNPTIEEGGSAVLSWSTMNATNVSIDNGVGVVALNGGYVVSPNVNTTYTITASGDGGDASATLTIVVNAPVDSDNDGITDNLDTCAETPVGETPDANGCSDSQKDSDGDGVIDNLDNCPGTPPNAPVDAAGCAETQKDTDNDDVTDDQDICSDTPDSEAVDANGCSDSQKDSDNDGITDNLDTCAETPEGETADANGCSDSQKDTDNDGVADNLDNCSGTPPNAPVNSNGCAETQIEVTLSADSHTITPGTTTALFWSSNNATSCSLEPRFGNVALNGYVNVSPTETTTYTITASNSLNSVTKEFTITVYERPTVSISLDKSQITESESATLFWSSANAESCSIEPGIGSVALNGSVPVTPEETTTYTISAVSQFSSTSKQITVYVVDHQVSYNQREALIALYNSTDGDNWSNNTNWLGEVGTECDWFGAYCDNDGYVTTIRLYNNQLSGPIPSELGKLENLQMLNLSNNQLSGPIPSELGNLTNLTSLNIRFNQLSGPIPQELGNLVNLKSLWLNNNQLSGQIPSELGNLTNLDSLVLSSNQLSGQIPLELGNLSNLDQLSLHTNQLSGQIPLELGNLTNLGRLELSNNKLSGQIPSELGNLTNLRYLSFQMNQLSGPIPSELGNLTNLRRLNLYRNQLSGPIPSELINLINLDDNASYFQHNSLYTTDNDLRTFLNSKQFGGDWESTQVIGDADNDGVNDNLDTCPGTPPNAPVDAAGCAETQKDTDNDGVTDDQDICSNTPDGETADADGCSYSQNVDSDNDGVSDYFDNCPGTPNGEPVYTNGCSNSQFSISIEEPIENSTVPMNNCVVKGSVINFTGNEFGVKINSVPAIINGNTFVASNVPFEYVGGNEILVVVTDSKGTNFSKSIPVFVESYENSIELSVSYTSGIMPLETEIQINSKVNIVESSLAWEGPGVVEDIENTIYDHKVRILDAGIYICTATVIDENNISYSATIAIEVLDRESLDLSLRGKWNSMKDAMKSGDVEKTVSHFDTSTKDSYRNVFTDHPEIMADFADKLNDIQLIGYSNNTIEYDIRAMKDGIEYSFYLQFVKDNDGIWKIRSF